MSTDLCFELEEFEEFLDSYLELLFHLRLVGIEVLGDIGDLFPGSEEWECTVARSVPGSSWPGVCSVEGPAVSVFGDVRSSGTQC